MKSTLALPSAIESDSVRLLCLIGRHRPDREHAHWNGLAYVGNCRGCERPIRRRRQGRWEVCAADEPERRYSI